MKHIAKSRVAAGLALLLLAAGHLLPVQAGSGESTLGAGGMVYVPRVGTESQLFPVLGAGSGGDPLVLALQVLRPSEPPQMLAVPESEVMRPDASCFVLYEEVSGAVFVVWEGRTGSHPMIKLASYREGTWSDVLQISDSAWTWKGSPRLAITRDSFELVDEVGATRLIQRTLLHVVWWENTAAGDRILYRPLVLLDGRFQGLGPVYVLNDLVDGTHGAAVEAPSESLTHHPSLQVAGDGRNLIVTFADEATRKLFVLDIGLLPVGLGLLGDDLYSFVEDFPLDASTGVSLEPLAGAVRARILISGPRYKLNPRSIQLLASDIYSQIAVPSDEGVPAGGLTPLAGVVRARILISGARLTSETIDRFTAEGSPSVLEASPDFADSLTDPQLAALPHLVRFSVLQELPAPLTGNGTSHVFSSADGQHLIVAWEDAGILRYRESLAGTWGEVASVEISDHLSLTEALEAVRQRALESF